MENQPFDNSLSDKFSGSFKPDFFSKPGKALPEKSQALPAVSGEQCVADHANIHN